MSWKFYIIIAFTGLICFGAGYAWGTYDTLNWVADLAIGYLEYKNVSLDVSIGALKDYAFKYHSWRGN